MRTHCNVVLLDYYRPLTSRGIGVDILSSEADVDGYSLVIAPAQVIVTPAMAENLRRYVEAGGTLLLTVRCGQKNEHNALFPALQPGPLRELAGADVEEYFALDEPAPVTVHWAEPLTGESRIWAERLRPLKRQGELITLAQFGASNGWLDGGIAIADNRVGVNGGRVFTVGALLDEALQESWVA